MNDEQHEPMPAYAQGDVFRQLLALAEQAGLTVAFIDGSSLEDGLAESDSESRTILMTNSDDFVYGFSPVSVLAEEMAIIMTETAQPKYQAVYVQFDPEDNSTDLISVALVQLAEMIVGANADREFKVIREIPRPE